MTNFIRLIEENNKAECLASTSEAYRQQKSDSRLFYVDPDKFYIIPGVPFAYWVSDKMRNTFKGLVPFGNDARTAWVGLQTNDDFQWVRLWWENSLTTTNQATPVPFAKGGGFSAFYADIYLSIRWGKNGEWIKVWKSEQLRQGKITANNSKCWNEKQYFRHGLTWTNATTSPFSARILFKNCIFGHRGPSAFILPENDLMFFLALFNSLVFRYLGSLSLGLAGEGRKSYEVGLIIRTPVPVIDVTSSKDLSRLARKAWSLKRSLDTVNETSHAFLLPAVIQEQTGSFQPETIEAEIFASQQQIDDVVFGLYGMEGHDRLEVEQWAKGGQYTNEAPTANEFDTDNDDDSLDNQTSLLSWCVGVAFGRFDWRLATGERAAPAEPEPFDPLPAKSPGMLPDGAAPFHANAGILVDDAGHPHDLPHWLEEVLMRVEMPVPHDLRNWLQREFFAAHLQQYSKSRRKAPIYWPLSTASGSYTLWLYYPSLTNQTLYTCVNDFLEPKLKQVGGELANLRGKGTQRSLSDEKQFEKLQAFELELTELRDTLLNIAPHYHPNQDDGVQITAAPLWPLFRHKPWQKVLKETWAKLEKGDYDWAHLAMQYWPERVRAKCKNDKSLAIAHGLEELYVEPAATTKKNTKK